MSEDKEKIAKDNTESKDRDKRPPLPKGKGTKTVSGIFEIRKDR